MTPESRGLTFDKVLDEEIEAIRRRRAAIDKEVRGRDGGPRPSVEDPACGGVYERLRRARKRAQKQHLVGLAFSGGGIRSATFAVGILQGLAKLGLLKRIDYLSTVSGGGYAGSWLAAWLKREGSVTNVEKQLARSRVTQSEAERPFVGGVIVDEEPEPIYHLRAYSRFLAPRSGFLTTDTWSIVSTYLRNVTINLLMLLPAAMVVVLLVRALVWIFRIAVPDGVYDPNAWLPAVAFTATGGTFLFRGLKTNARAINHLRHPVRPRPPVDKPKMFYGVALRLLVAVVQLPLALMAIFWALIPEMPKPAVPVRSREGGFWYDFVVIAWDWVFDRLGLAWYWAGRLPGAARDWAVHLPGAAWHWALDYAPTACLIVGLAALAIIGWARKWRRWTLIVASVLAPLALALLYDSIGRAGSDGAPTMPANYANYVIFPVVLGALMGAAYYGEAWGDPFLRNKRLLWSAIISGLAGGLLLAAVVDVLKYSCQEEIGSLTIRYRTDLLATFAPPACLMVVVATTIFHVAQLRDVIHEDEREWWAYFDAYAVILALVWLAAFGTILYLPAALLYIENVYIRTGVLAGLLSTWAGTTLAGIFAGKSRQTGSGAGSVPLEAIATVAPPVFLIGLFGLLSALASWLIDPAPRPEPPAARASVGVFYEPPGAEPVRVELASPPQAPARGKSQVDAYYRALNQTDLVWVVWPMLALGLVSWGAFYFVDVNLFSLNAMYANRLIRCYLGASRRMGRWERRWGPDGDRREGGGAPTNVGHFPPAAPSEAARSANPVTGFDLKDDLPLADLRIGTARDGTGYYGPLLLINTSLNLVATEDLAWSDRKSESFVLSPSHVGSKGTGYARVDPGKVKDNLTLGRAIAISGAAVDPNMNYHQSAALSAFLTIFNARLGYWIENPSRHLTAAPPPGPASAAREAEARAKEEAERARAVREAREQFQGATLRVMAAIAAKGALAEAARSARDESAAAMGRMKAAYSGWREARRRVGKAEGEVAAACAARDNVGHAFERLAAARSDHDDATDRFLILADAALADRAGRRQAGAGNGMSSDLAIDEAIANLKAAEAALREAIEAEGRTPDPAGAWEAESPRYSRLLITELLGGTDSKGEYVHLSDGGHFENTGVYELVRRRCRYIVACDANTDRNAADENLANLVRLVRIDFGIRIQLDTSPLRLDGDERICRSHVVIGSVRYDDVDSGHVPGVLVYIRTSMTGDEPSDIRNYAAVNHDFPYTSSANQFFDESQFESYRALGDHIARVVFEDAKTDAERIKEFWEEADPDVEFQRGNKRLFAALRRRWAEAMPGQDARFLESAQGYSELHRELRTDPALRALSHEVYPELAAAEAAGRGTPEGRRVELHAVARMLQVMENAWIGLDLKSHPEEPISHGWWSVYRRWTSTGAFHRNWPILRPEFSTEFVRFVETRLGLVPAMPEVVPWFDVPKLERDSLIEEFDREWPAPTAEESGDPEWEKKKKLGRVARGLGAMIGEAARIAQSDKAGQFLNVDVDAAWAIRQRPRPVSTGKAPASDCRGIILVMKRPSLHLPAKKAGDGAPNRAEYELLIWIRRSHRGIGLGTYGMEMGQLANIENNPKLRDARLYVRYPRVEDDSVRSMWKRFFSLYDFETEEGAPAEGNIWVSLYRDL